MRPINFCLHVKPILAYYRGDRLSNHSDDLFWKEKKIAATAGGSVLLNSYCNIDI